MKRFTIITILIGILCIGLMPVSAKSILPEQSQLPVPQGFCIRMAIPVDENVAIFDVQGLSIGMIPITFDIYLSEELNTTIYEVVGWIFTDEIRQLASFDIDLDEVTHIVLVDALSGLFMNFTEEAILDLLPPSACSFPMYRDNAALAQTFLVPETGYDVYQIFNGQGVLSFRVTQDNLANAVAGDVLGSNDAGNITFVYNGSGQCTVSYPYPDGKTNSKTFTCLGEITDWGRIPLDPKPNWFLP